METIISSRQLVDIAIALSLIEGAILLVLHRVKKRGLAPGEYLFNLASGLCLMFALRCALERAAWIWIALWLMASGLAHATDVWRRFRR